MALREEGMSLRLIADSASLKSGRKEVQEWTKQVNELSKRIKTGLGTKEDFARLKEHQQSATKNYGELQTKLEAYTRQRERYLTQIGEAPTVGLRQEAKIRARDVQGMMRDIAAQQGRLGGLGEAAGAGMGGAPAAGGGFRRGAAGAFGMARGLPIVGGMLTGGFLVSQLRSALTLQQQLSIAASETAMAFTVVGGQATIMTEALGKPLPGLGYVREELIRAGTAAAMAGGGGMVGARDVIARFARGYGADFTTLAALTGGAARAGAFRAGGPGAEQFLARAAGAVGGVGQDRMLALQQYMQQVLPFLQAQGRFQPYTDPSAEAFYKVFTGLGGAGNQFAIRNIGGVAQGLSQAIRAPQGERAQFQVMRALGMGGGRSMFEVMERMEQGLTPENLRAFVGRAQMLAGPVGVGDEESRRKRFILAVRGMTGKALTFEAARRLYTLPEGKVSQVEIDKIIEESKKFKLPPEAQAALDLKGTMDEVRDNLGKILADIVPLLADIAEGLVVVTGFIKEWSTGKILSPGQRGLAEALGVPQLGGEEDPLSGDILTDLMRQRIAQGRIQRPTGPIDASGDLVPAKGK